MPEKFSTDPIVRATQVSDRLHGHLPPQLLLNTYDIGPQYVVEPPKLSITDTTVAASSDTLPPQLPQE